MIHKMITSNFITSLCYDRKKRNWGVFYDFLQEDNSSKSYFMKYVRIFHVKWKQKGSKQEIWWHLKSYWWGGPVSEKTDNMETIEMENAA